MSSNLAEAEAPPKWAWYPQPGPQLAAFCAKWVECLFYGGARGGGKSDLLLGDFLQDVPTYGSNWRGIFFRRTYDELEEIIYRSHELFPQTGAVWGAVKKTWFWPNGAFLKMRYLERFADAERYQGHQYCVQQDTPIIMANGEARAIKDICVGDEVLTLEGPRKVRAVVAPYVAPCVRAVVGQSEQVQPVWHPILTASGWQSFASLWGTCAKAFQGKRRGCLRRPCGDASVECLTRVAGPAAWSFCTPTQCRYPYRRPTALLEKCQYDEQRHSGRVAYRQRQASLLQQCGAGSVLPLAVGDGEYAQPDWEIVSSSQSGYRSGRYCRDALLQHRSESDLKILPLQDDAASPCPGNYMPDARGNTQGYSPGDVELYEHPYTGEVRRASEESAFVPCEMSFLGNELVCDISIEHANHYITATTGMVNCNTWVGYDELTNWPDINTFRVTFACIRNAQADVQFKRIRASGNPGGSGHTWVKELFIDPAPLGYKPFKDKASQMTMMFIPAKVGDNQRLLEHDPQYINRLRASGPPDLVRCWLDGDWNVITGAYFPEFSIDKHVIRPMPLPQHWTRFVSFDWGSAKPFAAQWWAVSDGELPQFPKGALIMYREWYGAESANKGMKLKNEQIAIGIMAREQKDERISYRVADPAIFQADGGPCIAEQMANAANCCFQPGDNKRIPGWNEVRSRLVGEDSKPMLYLFSTCTDAIRTLPALQHDRSKPEDVDTDAEDHSPDAIRYGCMSRPWVAAPRVEPPPKFIQNYTAKQLFEKHLSARKQAHGR